LNKGNKGGAGANIRHTQYVNRWQPDASALKKLAEQRDAEDLPLLLRYSRKKFLMNDSSLAAGTLRPYTKSEWLNAGNTGGIGANIRHTKYVARWQPDASALKKLAEQRDAEDFPPLLTYFRKKDTQKAPARSPQKT
jgi:hypothetical protein